MKSTTLICALVAASFSFSSSAFAKDDHDRRSRGNDHEQSRDDRQGSRHADKRDQRDNRDHNRQADRRDDRSFERAQERRNDRQDFSYNARGPEFRRGGHVPREYRNRQYVVTDYRTYRLSPPPRGHQWVQVGSDYVLIAIATGLIANIILNQ
jgi:Ni/Co efflux regulator RcnB